VVNRRNKISIKDNEMEENSDLITKIKDLSLDLAKMYPEDHIKIEINVDSNKRSARLNLTRYNCRVSIKEHPAVLKKKSRS